MKLLKENYNWLTEKYADKISKKLAYDAYLFYKNYRPHYEDYGFEDFEDWEDFISGLSIKHNNPKDFDLRDLKEFISLGEGSGIEEFLTMEDYNKAKGTDLTNLYKETFSKFKSYYNEIEDKDLEVISKEFEKIDI